MNYLNNQIKTLYDVNDDDYIKWCKDTKKATSKKSTVSDFVYRLRTKRLVRDNEGNLIKKRVRTK